MTGPKGAKLGEVLVKKGHITEIQLISALQEQRRTKEFLGQILVKRGHFTEEELGKAIAEQFGMPFVKFKGQYVDWALAERFGSTLVVDHMCLPLRMEDDIMIVALVNPLDAWLRSRVEEMPGPRRVKWVVMGSGDMQEALSLYRQQVRDKIQANIQRPKE